MAIKDELWKGISAHFTLVTVTLSDPDTARGGSRLNPDEGRLRGVPKPPPPPGIPPSASQATASVIMKREAGQPPPAVRYGSTVCQ